MSYPLKLTIKSELVPIVLLALTAILSVYFYAHFPDRVISHWNFMGQPDGYSSRFGGAFFVPLMMAGIYALFLLLPWLDPRSERYAEFSKVYHFFKSGIMVVLFGVYISAGLVNLGYNVPINIVVPWLVGLMLMGLGNYMGKIKRNWFVGVRTPWTLSSENVWNKSNRFGGYMMMLFGALVIISPNLPRAIGIAAFILGAVLATVGTIAYSFYLYKQERKQSADIIVR